MESIEIDIINPKAKALLKDLADLDLIRIKSKTEELSLQTILSKLRGKANESLSMDEITAEVESVRKARYEQKGYS